MDESSSTDGPLRVERSDRIATVTLHRPEARNALNTQLRSALAVAINDLESDSETDVVILTGSDPAFCAGLDLKELGRGENRVDRAPTGPDIGRKPFAALTKPLIGAINGVAITGGFELALNCDFLIGSERAAFADTHARVGVMPGWGLSVLLPQAIGVRRAREMSLTGNFMGAEEACTRGLLNRVVPHDQLLTIARELASDIVSNDQRGVRQMLATYRDVSGVVADPAWDLETRNAKQFRGDVGFDPATVEARRQAIVDRGRSQVGH